MVSVLELYDLIIVGGGPGGLTAGMYAMRAALKTVLIEKGVPGGSLARGDKGLMDFVQGGVARGDEPGGEGPGPVPTDARAANAAVQQRIENEVFGEMRRLADVVMDDFKGGIAEGRREPAENGPNDGARVCGGKGVCGSCEDNDAPEQGGPPGTEPAGNQGFGRNAVADLVERGGGARIAPGFGRGHSEYSVPLHCKRRVKGLQAGWGRGNRE